MLSLFLAIISIVFLELIFRTKPNYIGFSMIVAGLSIFGLSVAFSYIVFENKLINFFLVCFPYIGYCFTFGNVAFKRFPIKTIADGFLYLFFGMGMILWLTTVIGALLGMEMKSKKVK